VVTVWDPSNPAINRFTGITLTTNIVGLDFAGIPGFTYRIERSTDFVGWTSLGSAIVPTNGLVHFEDLAVPQTSAYYRAYTQ